MPTTPRVTPPPAPSNPLDWASSTRTVGAAHRSVVKGHFLRLDAASRRGRFWCDASVANIQDYVDAMDLGDRAIILGCFPDQTMRGLVEMRPTDKQNLIWEAVLSVETAWQDQGVGTWLLQEALRHVKERGGTRVYLKADVSNTVAKRMAISLGATLSEVEGDAVARVDLRQFDPEGSGASWVQRVKRRAEELG